jgi:hypothetical protein
VNTLRIRLENKSEGPFWITVPVGQKLEIFDPRPPCPRFSTAIAQDLIIGGDQLIFEDSQYTILDIQQG